MDVEEDEDVLEEGSFRMVNGVSIEGGRLARFRLEDVYRQFPSRRKGGERFGEGDEKGGRGGGGRRGHDDEIWEEREEGRREGRRRS